jgi:FlaA1/EpsC-like NDP-sugar epimerase
MSKAGWKSLLVFFYDMLAVTAAWSGAYWIRFNFIWPEDYSNTIWIGLALILPAHALICSVAGLYRGLWIFASLPDLKRVFKAVFGSLIVMVAYALLAHPTPLVPRSMVVLFPMLLAMWMGGGRIAYRMWKEHRMFGGLAAQGKPVIVIGAGRAASMLVRDMERCADWRLVGLLDDNCDKWGRELGAHRVIGGISSLPAVAHDLKVRHVILAIPSASVELRRRLAELCAQSSLQLMTVPALEDIMSGKVSVNSIRRVEIEDLLGRKAISIDNENVINMLADKVILVTGAGGSIGSELCRQIARFAPSKVLLFEQSEYALYTIEQWFLRYKPEVSVVPIAGDVKDTARLDEVFTAYRPQVVFHAAAYKHVPLMEIGNAWQAVRNNVWGTLNVARVSQQHGVRRFVLISTDKAVNPTNVMGATKRLAEMLCQTLFVRQKNTLFTTVRFGNVLGSNGSVIPKFQTQIACGGPVTVTHPEITRYFMSIPEAALLVLQAGTMGEGGEIFVLDMGEPVKIADLARNMIRLSGFTEEEIRIEYTGLRPGEKLYEEILADAEHTCATPHPKLRVARSRPVAATLGDDVEHWLNATKTMSDEGVRESLKRWIPEYEPMCCEPPLLVSTPTPSASNPRNLLQH